MKAIHPQEEIPTDVFKSEDDRFRTWYFPSHNFTLMVLWTKFLTTDTERLINGSSSGVFDMHIDKVDGNWLEKLPEINYAIISAGHWFFRKSYLHENDNLIRCVFCDDTNITNLGLSYTFKTIFRTAPKNINGCEECKGLVTLLRTFSPSHFEHGTWNNGGRCNRTKPLSKLNLGGNEWEIRSIQMKEVERAEIEGESGKKRFGALDVTRAMLMRPDGHPDLYWNNNWMQGYSDCVHWCLPGPIDAWNDLLLEVLKRGSYNFLEEQISRENEKPPERQYCETTDLQPSPGVTNTKMSPSLKPANSRKQT